MFRSERQIFNQLENKQRKTRDAILKCYPFRGQLILTTSQVLFVYPFSSTGLYRVPVQNISRRSRVPLVIFSFVRPQTVEARWPHGWHVRLRIEQSWFEHCPGTMCCVLDQDTLLSQCLSPPKCIDGYHQLIKCWGYPCDGVASHPEGSKITPCHLMLLKSG